MQPFAAFLLVRQELRQVSNMIIFDYAETFGFGLRESNTNYESKEGSAPIHLVQVTNYKCI